MIVGDTVLLQLLDNLRREDGLNSRQAFLLRIIRRYVDQDLSKYTTVASVAEDLGYAPYYLSRLFKMNTGMTLGTYI